MITTLASLSLLCVWLAGLALAATAFAYFIVSLRMRRTTASPAGSSPERLTALKRRTDRLATALEISAAAFFALLIVALAVNAVWLFRLNAASRHASASVGRRFIDEQYHPDRVSPVFSLALFDDHTIGGENPKVGDSLVVTAKLMAAPARKRKCDAKYLSDLLSTTTLRLESPDLALSRAPVVDNYNTCFLKWRWIAVVQHPGTTAALAELSIREARGERLVASKPIHFVVPAKFEEVALVPSITSIAVALLSIVGALLTAWLNRKTARQEAAAASVEK